MWQTVLNSRLSCFHQNKDYFDEFSHLKTNQERVNVCIRHKEPGQSFIHDLKAKYLDETHGKNLESSVKYREIGNKHYKARDLGKAWTNYQFALIHAQKESEQYLLALANRSACLYELKLYTLCLNDLHQIDKIQVNANAWKLPASFVEKIANRKSNCLANLKNIQGAKPNNIEEQGLNSPHSKYPHMNSRLNIEYSNKDGRYCVSNDDIKAGDILFDERPYCAILLPQFRLNYCDCCFKRLCLNGDFVYCNIQACDTCNDVLFCSIDCKKTSRTYHKYECSMLGILHDLGIGHLAYRMVACTDSNVLQKYFHSNSQGLREYYEVFNGSKDRLYLSNDYDTVFNLITNEEHTHVDDLYQFTLTAILLGKNS